MTLMPPIHALAPGAVGLRHPLSHNLRAGEYPLVPDTVLSLLVSEDRLVALREQELAPVELFNDVIAAAGDTLADGLPLPEDLLDRLQAADAAAERQRVANLAIARLHDALEHRWRTVLAENVDEMLSALAGVLDEILAAVKALAGRLGDLDPSDPEAVSEASPEQREAIAELKALRPRYRRLRHSQEQLLKHSARPPGRHTAWDVFFKTLAHEFSAIDRHGRPAEDLPTVLWFRRLLFRDDVWLPTLTQLVDVSAPAPSRAAVIVGSAASPAGVWDVIPRPAGSKGHHDE